MIAGFFAISSDEFSHWFLIPVMFCGILIGEDAVQWFRGGLTVFDPIGVIGLLGFHFFFLAPLLHVYWGYWLPRVDAPADWRDWIGGMAILNCLGLLVYRFSRSTLPLMYGLRASNHTIWRLHKLRFAALTFLTLLLSGLAQASVYARFGGIAGYVEAVLKTPEVFQNTGWVFVFSESFPLVAMLGFTVYARAKRWRLNGISVVVVLTAFLLTQLLFGGLRGSRSNTVWALFWAVGLIHFWIRPVSRQLIYSGLVFLFAFLYAYGFYKEYGLKGLSAAVEDSDQRIALQKKRGRDMKGIVLGDFGRTDVQAYILYKVSRPNSDYEYAWGRTYIGALALLIPRAILPDRPRTSVQEGTEVLNWQGAYLPGKFESSKVYGLAGEAMMNFGPLAVPFLFTFLGLVVGGVSWLMSRLSPIDSRLLLLPFLVNLCFPVLAGDSDNIVWFIFKQGLLPILLVFASSKRETAGLPLAIGHR